MAKALLPKNKVLAQIKEDLDSFVGKEVTVRANKGRRKVVVASGVLERTYPNLFVVRLADGHTVKRLSYTYSDVLTEMVTVTGAAAALAAAKEVRVSG